MLARVNQEREKKKLPALVMNSKLQAAAQRQADDMADKAFMSHKGSDGSTMKQRIVATGFTGGGMAENVASGQKTVDEVVDSWMKSSGHRRNILGDYTVFGAAYAHNANGKYKHYWTQVFGKGGEDGDDVASIPWSSTGHEFGPEQPGHGEESGTTHGKEDTVEMVTCVGCWCWWR
ncbi:hypothetical protein BBJ28_00009296 [Nothophytophthora sp. Chile5]|nr:hypothetical protein BBJ28_00009296 [Nothophytophthora sp. Chile5]